MLELERLVVKLGADATQFFTAMNGVESRLLVFGTTAVGILARYSVQLGSQLEQVALGFEVMTGSAQTSMDMLKQIKEFAIVSPFQAVELAKQGQRLLAYGVAADQVVPAITRLSAVASGIGSGSEGLDRLSYAFGQVITAGRFMGTELRQFAEAGVGAKDFADAMGVTTTRFRELMAEGKVGPDVMIKAFNRLTSEGGRFEGMVERASKTAQGRFNAVKESLQLGFGEAAQKFLKGMGEFGLFDKMEESAKRLKNWLDQLDVLSFKDSVEGLNNTWIGIELTAKNTADLFSRLSSLKLPFSLNEAHRKEQEGEGVGFTSFFGALAAATPAAFSDVFDVSKLVGMALVRDTANLGGLASLLSPSAKSIVDGLDQEITKQANELGEGNTTKAIRDYFDNQLGLNKDPGRILTADEIEEKRRMQRIANRPIEEAYRAPVKPMSDLEKEVNRFVDSLGKGARKLANSGGGAFLELSRATRAYDAGLISESEFGFGAVGAFRKIRDRLQPKDVKTPDAITAGSKEAQDIINRSTMAARTVDKLQEVLDVLREGQKLRQEEARDFKETKEALQEIRDRGLFNLKGGRI